jgi:iron complex outermembrane receptor protein
MVAPLDTPRLRPARSWIWMVCACACCAAWSVPANAADPADATVQEGARERARLLRKAVLVYPQAAAGQHGDVVVEVTVDASGRVTRQTVREGPAVFHAAAMDAAATLVFAPARLDGEPVGSTERVVFHFAPPLADDEAAYEVVVHADDPDREDIRTRTTLDEATLEQSAGDDLAQTLAQVPGVTLSQGTADASKPIIRGHQERRLLVLHDGVRHESQKWGPDHATEIDPFAAGSISVIRGAAGTRYGPDAIGGVVLVDPPPLRSTRGVEGKALLAYQTNGRRPYGALRLDLAPSDRFTFRLEGNGAIASTLSAPTYLLGNTQSQVFNLGVAAEYRWASGSVRATWSRYDLRAGVFYGVRNSTPSEFAAQLDSDRPVSADLWERTTAIDRPYQDVVHDQVALHLTEAGRLGGLSITYAFQHNRRLEFEQVRGTVTGPQYDFLLRTHSLDASWRHPAVDLGAAELTGTVGLQGGFQENVYRGYGLLPNYRAFSGGVFAVERLAWSRVDVEAGIRADGLDRTAFLDAQDYERHLRRETLRPGMCTLRSGGGGRCPTRYPTGTVSLGALAHVVPDVLDVKVDLSSASRFPNIDEQYLLGSAPSFPVYGKGNPSLGVETAWSAATTVGLRLPAIETEIAGFTSWIDDYIQFAPDLAPDGTPRLDVTIRGTWPSFVYRPVDAMVSGIDGVVSLGPSAVVGLDVQGAMVRAVDLATGDQLVGTPGDRIGAVAWFRPRPDGLRDVAIGLSTDVVARQSRVDPAIDFAPAPPTYALLGARASAAIPVGRRRVRVGLDAHNLLNTRYREYTSLLRYYADQPGRDVRLRVGMDL